MNFNPLLIARNFANLSPSVRKLVEAGRIVSVSHWTALRIGIRQLMAKVKRGRRFHIETSMLRNLLTWVEDTARGDRLWRNASNHLGA